MQSERKNQAKKKAQESGASWGFGEDAEEEDDDDDEPESDEEADKKEKLPDYLRNVRKNRLCSSYRPKSSTNRC